MNITDIYVLYRISALRCMTLRRVHPLESQVIIEKRATGTTQKDLLNLRIAPWLDAESPLLVQSKAWATFLYLDRSLPKETRFLSEVMEKVLKMKASCQSSETYDFFYTFFPTIPLNMNCNWLEMSEACFVIHLFSWWCSKCHHSIVKPYFLLQLRKHGLAKSRFPFFYFISQISASSLTLVERANTQKDTNRHTQTIKATNRRRVL